MTFAFVLLAEEARSIWANPSATDSAWSWSAAMVYAVAVTALSGFRVKRLQLLYDVAVGFAAAAFTVPFALFPDGFAAIIRELGKGANAMFEVGLVVSCIYFIALAAVAGAAGALWFVAMMFAARCVASTAKWRSEALLALTFVAGWCPTAAIALFCQLVGPDSGAVKRSSTLPWELVLALSTLGSLVAAITAIVSYVNNRERARQR